VTARVFREGHDAVGATVVLTDPNGVSSRVDMVQIWPAGLDIWQAWVRPDKSGSWTFRVEAWSDPWETWRHAAQAKLPAGVDTDLVLREGRALLDRCAATAARRDPEASVTLESWSPRLAASAEIPSVISFINDPELALRVAPFKPHELTTPTAEFPLWVDRKQALFSSWYEFFPRSQGARLNGDGSWVSGGFATSRERLDAAAAMGFDVVYLPPIHPIGHQYRKGPDNTLGAGPNDPGSPWAIGSQDGGHDAIHPDLGDFDDFARFVAHARSLGLEVALDFALQCSPDHPWVSEHPEWFSHRIDGTIAYAENPPKKYQDIYPLNFDQDPEGIRHEALRLIEFWIERGVTIFRVDNPHTKPVDFWAWLLAEVRERHPHVLFLAEAFTRPEMMHALGKVGFHQSYTYFTWRNTRWELSEYLKELSGETADYFRPNFFVNTPDIDPFFLQSGNPAAFAIRAILAATMAPNWGVYSGFEIYEHEPLAAGREEYRHSEKYEYRPRDYFTPGNLSLLITMLNRIRRDHPALQQLRRTVVLETENEGIFAFCKTDGEDRVIVICSLDPVTGQSGWVHVDHAALGLPPDTPFEVHDELTGNTWTWNSSDYVNLYPAQPAHILTVRTPPLFPPTLSRSAHGDL
jgi:starch synthase (maltosyl-transferring)